MIVKSLSDKRFIIQALINGKSGNLLIDTGASISLINSNVVKKYNIKLGSVFNGSVINASGDSMEIRHTQNLIVDIEGIHICQFYATDLTNIISSIKKETDIDICGIIGLAQIKSSEMQIIAKDNIIKLGY